MAVRVTGKVNRLYVDVNGCYIRLDGLPPEDTPKDGYFQLKKSHQNYDALYSLALTAAANRLDLTVRIVGDDIKPTGAYPDVNYMIIDW